MLTTLVVVTFLNASSDILNLASQQEQAWKAFILVYSLYLSMYCLGKIIYLMNN